MGVIGLIIEGLPFIIALIVFIARCGVLAKAGQRWYKGVIPIYAEYTMGRITLGNGVILALLYVPYYAIKIYEIVDIMTYAPLIENIPSILIILKQAYYVMLFIVCIWFYIKLSEAFGMGVGFGLGLRFLPVIFFPLLAFTDLKYVGPLKDEVVEITDDYGYF